CLQIENELGWKRPARRPWPWRLTAAVAGAGLVAGLCVLRVVSIPTSAKLFAGLWRFVETNPVLCTAVAVPVAVALAVSLPPRFPPPPRPPPALPPPRAARAAGPCCVPAPLRASPPLRPAVSAPPLPWTLIGYWCTLMRCTGRRRRHK